MFQIIEYIKFLFKSTNQHGVHSPFVYDLVTKCFYNKTSYDSYNEMLDYRKALLANNSRLQITDYGSGSRVFKSNERAINSISKTSGSTLKRAQLLYRLVNYLKPKHTLELGTSLGIATQAMALGHKENHVTTLEGCPNISSFTKQHLSDFNVVNIELVIGEFQESLAHLKEKEFDLVFFDGNHNKIATLQYFEDLVNGVHNDTVFIFDDIHWSKDMTEAWNVIKSHPKVTVTIDTFFYGFVFFRKEQAKENFIIRL